MKDKIREWAEQRSKTISACLDLADLNGAFDEMITDIIHDCIQDLGLGGEWVSVDKNLPQVDFEVLACCDDDVFMAIYREFDDHEYFENSQTGNVAPVTHWQDLPTPPTEDKA